MATDRILPEADVLGGQVEAEVRAPSLTPPFPDVNADRIAPAERIGTLGVLGDTGGPESASRPPPLTGCPHPCPLQAAARRASAHSLTSAVITLEPAAAAACSERWAVMASAEAGAGAAIATGLAAAVAAHPAAARGAVSAALGAV